MLTWIISKSILRSSSKNIASDSIKVTSLSSKKEMLKKISELEILVDSYKTRDDINLALESENQKLKAELHRSTNRGGTLANVITDPSYSIYDTFVIDAGVVDNISVGQNVYAFNNILLGTITKVDYNRSVVSLFSQSGKETYGNTTTNDVAATLTGRGGGEYEIRMPRDIYFEVGELISAQSVSTSLLAKVEKILTDPRDPFQKLLAKAPINLQNLKWVVVR